MIVAPGIKLSPVWETLIKELLSVEMQPIHAVLIDYLTLSLTSGQSYKQFTIVIYDSRVVIWGNFKSNTTLES